MLKLCCIHAFVYKVFVGLFLSQVCKILVIYFCILRMFFASFGVFLGVIFAWDRDIFCEVKGCGPSGALCDLTFPSLIEPCEVCRAQRFGSGRVRASGLRSHTGLLFFLCLCQRCPVNSESVLARCSQCWMTIFSAVLPFLQWIKANPLTPAGTDKYVCQHDVHSDSLSS